ncbi:MAG: effector binding domain-containing protein [Rickettsiaceae bacterium]|nr:effector binding domain-containing protein [Rickettsiaceae bacterium]
MKKTNIELPEIKLVGITARTSNANEMNPDMALIGPTINRYFSNNLGEKILDRVKPYMTYCVYTNYASDESGDYTYFVGEEVSSFENVDSIFEKHIIPAQTYIKFECGPGNMPDLCISAWQDIWQMTPDDLGGARSYISDFEIYDQRAIDPENTVLDIYLGVDN